MRTLASIKSNISDTQDAIDALMAAFVWGISIKGEDYWADVARALDEQIEIFRAELKAEETET